MIRGHVFLAFLWRKTDTCLTYRLSLDCTVKREDEHVLYVELTDLMLVEYWSECDSKATSPL